MRACFLPLRLPRVVRASTRVSVSRGASSLVSEPQRLLSLARKEISRPFDDERARARTPAANTTKYTQQSIPAESEYFPHGENVMKIAAKFDNGWNIIM